MKYQIGKYINTSKNEMKKGHQNLSLEYSKYLYN